VLLLRRAGLSGEHYQLCNWSQIDLSEGWRPVRGEDFFGSLDDVKRQVAVLIEAVETKWAKYQPDIRIEVVLSGELLNLDIDLWSWKRCRSDVVTPSRFARWNGCRQVNGTGTGTPAGGFRTTTLLN
jgi:NTP-dependent ternary conflict system VMAP-like protein